MALGDGWRERSGVDVARELAAERTPLHELLGLTPGTVDKGHVEMLWSPGAGLLNRGGVVHGGHVATALDEVCGMTATSASEPATPYLTMSLNTDFVRPVLAGERHLITGTVLRAGALRVLVEARVTDTAERLCAYAVSSLTPNRRFRGDRGRGDRGRGDRGRDR